MTTIPVFYDHKFISLFKIAQNVTIPYVHTATHITWARWEMLYVWCERGETRIGSALGRNLAGNVFVVCPNLRLYAFNHNAKCYTLTLISFQRVLNELIIFARYAYRLSKWPRLTGLLSPTELLSDWLRVDSLITQSFAFFLIIIYNPCLMPPTQEY